MTVRTAIISTGSEIVQGLYADTNAMSLSRRLTDAGFEVARHMAVPDDQDLMARAVADVIGQVELVILTGGLGPTADDLTRNVLADVWKSPLRRVNRAGEMIRARIHNRGLPLLPEILHQADVPECARVLLNFWGTASGFVLPPTDERPVLMALPGVPREWRAMYDRYFTREVACFFDHLPMKETRTFHLALIPESQVNRLLHGLFNSETTARIGLLATNGIVRIRVTVSGKSEDEVAERLSTACDRVRDRIPADAIFSFGPDEATLEGEVVRACEQAGVTIAVAESCTGGGVARRLTNVPGASRVFLEGATVYHNEAKTRRLGVDPEILENHGAVSSQCAAAMADGIRELSGADLTIAVTGIAGPGGGTPAKPVGTIWFALSDKAGASSISRLFPGDRALVREFSEHQTLDLLRRRVRGLPLQS